MRLLDSNNFDYIFNKLQNELSKFNISIRYKYLADRDFIWDYPKLIVKAQKITIHNINSMLIDDMVNRIINKINETSEDSKLIYLYNFSEIDTENENILLLALNYYYEL